LSGLAEEHPGPFHPRYQTFWSAGNTPNPGE
jgi:hypothetical protein